jgi:hypothetical protein
MQLEQTKGIVAALWVLAVSIVGLALPLHSLSAWVMLAIFAGLPPLLMMRLWRVPAETISESIQKQLH